VKYADVLMLLARKDMVLVGMIDRLTENGKVLWGGNKCKKK
jgi:hypothetical protein